MEKSPPRTHKQREILISGGRDELEWPSYTNVCCYLYGVPTSMSSTGALFTKYLLCIRTCTNSRGKITSWRNNPNRVVTSKWSETGSTNLAPTRLSTLPFRAISRSPAFTIPSHVVLGVHTKGQRRILVWSAISRVKVGARCHNSAEVTVQCLPFLFLFLAEEADPLAHSRPLRPLPITNSTYKMLS